MKKTHDSHTIIFLVASLGSGGSERVVSLLANSMVERGQEVEIICLKYDDVFYQTHKNVRITLANKYASNFFFKLFWLRKYLKRRSPDVVIAFTEGVYCFATCALLRTKIPIIASERNDPAHISWKRKFLKKIFLPHVDGFVVQTEHIKSYFKGSVANKVSVIHNPVNEEVFKSQTSRIEQKDNRIVSVARLYPQKNQEMMIRAFALIAHQYPDWQLVIFGEGPKRQCLQLTIDNLQLTDRILLQGRTAHVIEELRRSKFFCMSSDYEGMSNSMIEACCVGLPIISTKVSGTDELVEDGVNGYLVDTGDVEGMAKVMEKLILDEKQISIMGDCSRAKASLFQIDGIVRKWFSVIEKYTTIRFL